jgi:signal recognition particle GTPase
LKPALSKKYPTQKRACGVAQVVEHLPSMREALSSNSNTDKTQTKQNKTKKIVAYITKRQRENTKLLWR